MKRDTSRKELSPPSPINTVRRTLTEDEDKVDVEDGIMAYIDKVIMAKIPLKGGVSTEVKQEIKSEIAELIKGAVEATVSRMSPIPSTSTTGLYTATDVADMMKTTLRELLPDLVTTIREETEKSTGYGTARGGTKQWDTLAKSIAVKAWEGPSERAWDVVRLDLKKNATIHRCLDIIEGTATCPDEDDDPEGYSEWKMKNTTAMILLSNTFTKYQQSKEIIFLYTEEDGFNGDAHDCYTELDSEFDDDEVYDRVTLENEYDKYTMLSGWSPSRFITKLSNRLKCTFFLQHSRNRQHQKLEGIQNKFYHSV